ncbi:hypothetical protein VNO80_27685 [Phaseolus coccineus]|uniref:Uncharacterized protein n=1 Tax=Phaseolus coccineus TaxID=3886 RepID=A0AAN9LGP6_PHACN
MLFAKTRQNSPCRKHKNTQSHWQANYESISSIMHFTTLIKHSVLNELKTSPPREHLLTATYLMANHHQCRNEPKMKSRINSINVGKAINHLQEEAKLRITNKKLNL